MDNKRLSKAAYKTVIVGAGKIGAFFDNPNSTEILTHAHAVYKHPNFHLVGFVDINKQQAEKAAKIWQTQTYNSLEEAFNKENPDIVIIASPDESHFPLLLETVRFKPKLVLAEKPLAQNLLQANQITKLYQQRQIPLQVNYSRRFIADFQNLKTDIQNQKYGLFIFGNGYYGKGLLHNGSHMIDLIRLLLGEVNKIKILNHQDDCYPFDPSVTARLYFSSQQVFTLQAVSSQLFTIFELDLMFERGRIRIIDSGLTIEQFTPKKSSLFAGYKYLSEEKKTSTKLSKSIYYCLDNIYDYLKYNKPLLCPLKEGYKTLRTCLKIQQQI